MGKTLIFLLPFLERLVADPLPPSARISAAFTPEALILVPTDELAAQIASVARQIVSTERLAEAPAVAHMDGSMDADALAGARLLVGTPTRLLAAMDHSDGATLSLREVRMVAIDEADVLYSGEGDAPSEEEELLQWEATSGEESSSLAHGLALHNKAVGAQRAAPPSDEINFGSWSATGTAGQQSEEAEEGSARVYAVNVAQTADAVLERLPPPAARPAIQTILTMATVGAVHNARLRRHFPRATRISHAGVMPPTLRQRFHLISEGAPGGKRAKLLDVLRDADDVDADDADADDAERALAPSKALVFCTDAHLASELTTFLRSSLPEPMARKTRLLSEALPAAERRDAVAALADGTARLLVCTDVASRGLDFGGVRHVVMYDLPLDVAAFIHRAGRTARQGEAGLMSCLVGAHEVHLMRELHLGEAVPGTALHRAAGRLGAAPAAHRAKPPEQRGWLSKEDLALAERSVAATRPTPDRPSTHDGPDGGTVGGQTWMP